MTDGDGRYPGKGGCGTAGRGVEACNLQLPHADEKESPHAEGRQPHRVAGANKIKRMRMEPYLDCGPFLVLLA